MKHNKQQDKNKNRSLGILPIGIVTAMIGYVAIKGTDGIEKLLKAGEKLFSNDEIITGKDGHAEIELADGSRIELESDSNVVLDDDVIDAKVLEQLQQISPAGGEQNDGGFDVARVDIQQQLDSTATGNDGSRGSPGDTGLAARAQLPGDVTLDDLPGNEVVTPPATPEPPDHPVGKLPVITIADVVVIEPEPGGQGGSGSHGSDETHDTGSDTHGEDEGSDAHGESGGHDSGSDSHGSDEGHDTGGDTHGEDEGGHETAGPVYAIFTIALSAPALTTVTVDYATANGTAISGGRGVNENDYGHTQGTLTILPGETSGTIQVEILGDRGVEPDNEYFYINLSNAHGASIEDGQAIASIIDSGHGEGSLGEGDILVGTDADDILTGSGGRDTIYGEDGDDILSGRGGPDSIFGGEGDDNMQGLGGPDTLSGGAGNDVMLGHGGPDVLDGGPGDDSLDGGGSPDTLIGGEGSDILVGGGGPDLLQGGPGNDTLYGDGGADILDGGSGNDILVGGGAGDVFRFDNFDAVDSVIDFNPQQGDVIDISALLEDFNVNDPISNYVQLSQTTAPDTFELMVNPSGSSQADFQLLVTLENFHHTASVDELVDNGNLIVSDLV